jgi:hypothetical protein
MQVRLCCEYFHWLMKKPLFGAAIRRYYPDYNYSLANKTVTNRSWVCAWNIPATFKLDANDSNYQNKQKLLE